MNFEKTDPIFFAWAERHRLQVYTDCKDEIVRMVRIQGKGKEFADIGLGNAQKMNDGKFRISTDGKFWVDVGIARRPSRNSQFEQLEATLETLADVLEQAFERALFLLKAPT